MRSSDHVSCSTFKSGKVSHALASAGRMRRNASSLPSLWAMVITIGSVTAFSRACGRGWRRSPRPELPFHLADAQGLATDDGVSGASEPAPFHVPSEQCNILHVAAEQRVESITHD